MPHKRAKRSVREAETAKKGKNLAPPSSATLYDDTPRSASRILNSWKVQQKFRESGRKNSEDLGIPRGGPSSGSGGGQGAEKKKSAIPKILPQETLGEYNRRVESLLRPALSSAIKTAESDRAAELSEHRRSKKENKRRTRLEKLLKEGKVGKEVLEEFEKGVKEKKRKRDNGEDEDGEEEESGEEDGGGDKAGKKAKNGKSGGKEREVKTFAPLPPPRRLNDIVQAPPTLPHLRRSSQPKSTGKGVYGAIGDSGKLPLNAGQKRIMEEERERVVRLYRDMKAQREEKARLEKEKEKTAKKAK